MKTNFASIPGLKKVLDEDFLPFNAMKVEYLELVNIKNQGVYVRKHTKNPGYGPTSSTLGVFSSGSFLAGIASQGDLFCVLSKEISQLSFDLKDHINIKIVQDGEGFEISRTYEK